MSSIKGFTLIELLMVVAVIGILATIGVVVYPKYIASARDSKREQTMKDIQMALELYKGRYQSYFNADNSFCGLVETLISQNFLLLHPQDPFTKADICSDATNGNKYIGGAMYTYIATPAAGTADSYLLKLSREAGGYSNFYSPQ